MKFLPSFLLLCLPLALHAADTPRLNILFVFADDWGRYASAYAAADGKPSINDVIKTPNVDRIAREGALFRRAFVNAPSCTPCRSSMLTGRFFFNTGRGAILNGAVWDPAIPSFPLLLRDAGYQIGKSYKVWSPGTPADAPYGAPDNRFAKAGLNIGQFSELMMAAKDREAQRRDIMDKVAANFAQFYDARKEAQPWCYWFGPGQTHRPIAPGSGKALWGIEPDALKGKVPPFLPDNEVIRADLADYLGEVQSLDAALGVLLGELEKRGELEHTLVVLSGDHGMPGVTHGKCNLYDFGTHVGLPNNSSGWELKFNELQAEGGGAGLEVFELAGFGRGGALRGEGGVVGFDLRDHGVEDSRQFVRGGDDAFGFAKPRFHAPGVVAQRTFTFGGGFRRKAQGGGDPAGDAPGFRFEDAPAADAVIRAQAKP